MNTSGKFHLFMSVAATLFLSSCGGSSGNDGGGGRVTISASVGNTYYIAYSPTFLDHVQEVLFGKRAIAINSSAVVDQVVAIPSYQGNYGPSDLENMRTINGVGRSMGSDSLLSHKLN